MKRHTMTYLNHFGYDISSWIPCEVCGKTAIDIHHVEARGLGGSKEADNIENLMALCREDHVKYGDKKQHKEWLKSIHQERLTTR
jgi:5-methylcytosine-specific restriction endonuclease McrA